jgi:hypothetical protein
MAALADYTDLVSQRERGDLVRVDPDFVAEVKREMAARKISAKSLALKAKSSEPTVSRLVKHGLASRVTLAKISAAMGIADPGEKNQSDSLALWMSVGDRLHARHRERFDLVLKALDASLSAEEAFDDVLDVLRQKP